MISYMLSIEKIEKLIKALETLKKCRQYEINPIIKKGFFDEEDVKQTLKALSLDIDKEEFTIEDLQKGMNEELEHVDITEGDPILTAKIALVHLKEDPEYYDKEHKGGDLKDLVGDIQRRTYGVIPLISSLPYGAIPTPFGAIKEGLLKAFQLSSNAYRAGDPKLRQLKYGELHYPTSNFMGPGTRIDLKEVRDFPPYDEADACAKKHDLDYLEATQKKKQGKIDDATYSALIRDADIKIMDCFKKAPRTNSTKAGESGIQTKMNLENILPMLVSVLAPDYKGSKEEFQKIIQSERQSIEEENLKKALYEASLKNKEITQNQKKEIKNEINKIDERIPKEKVPGAIERLREKQTKLKEEESKKEEIKKEEPKKEEPKKEEPKVEEIKKEEVIVDDKDKKYEKLVEILLKRFYPGKTVEEIINISNISPYDIALDKIRRGDIANAYVPRAEIERERLEVDEMEEPKAEEPVKEKPKKKTKKKKTKKKKTKKKKKLKKKKPKKKGKGVLVIEGGASKVQSIIFNKDKYSINDAKRWLREHKFKVEKVDETMDYYRFRQMAPDYTKQFRTINLGKTGDIKGIIEIE